MNISLTSELEQLVNDKVKSGKYQTASEVVREGLRLLNERDLHSQAIRRDMRTGFDAVDRGEFTEYEAGEVQKLAEHVKARGRKRLHEERQVNGKR